MYYFFAACLTGGQIPRRQPVCSQARRARISTVSTIFAHHTKKAACRCRCISIQPHVLANKAGSGYLLVSQLVCLPWPKRRGEIASGKGAVPLLRQESISRIPRGRALNWFSFGERRSSILCFSNLDLNHWQANKSAMLSSKKWSSPE